MNSIANAKIVNEMYDELFPKLHALWGFHPWFLIRIHTFYQLFQFDNGRFSAEKQYRGTVLLGDVLKALKATLLLVYSGFFSKRLFLDALVIGYKRNESNVGDESINAYMHPFHKLCIKAGVSSMIFYVDSPCVSDKTSLAIYKRLTRYKILHDFLFRIALRFKHGRQTELLSKNEQLISDWLRSKGIGPAEKIATNISNVMIRQVILFNAYKSLFNALHAKVIWSYCFYDNEIAAMSRAAKHHSIRVVEYQHSQISDNHFAYAKWEAIEKIKDFFPDVFWLWREQDRETVTRNFANYYYNFKAIIGGNLWLAENLEFKPEQRKANTILVTLQGFWIPDFLEQFIKKSDDFIWYFRLHPRYPSDLEKVIALFQECSSKVEYLETTRLPLYSVLRRVDTHITSYSGTALEAQAFSVKNIIVGKDGYKVYKREIEDGSFHFVDDVPSLVSALKKQDTTLVTDRIVADLDTIGLCFNQLFVNSGE